MRRARLARLMLGVFAVAGAASGQPATRLDQINARRAGDSAPALKGRQVAIEGVVAAPAIPINEYTHLAIRDDAGAGAVVESAGRAFAALRPGDRISVRGTVGDRGGLPV